MNANLKKIKIILKAYNQETNIAMWLLPLFCSLFFLIIFALIVAEPIFALVFMIVIIGLFTILIIAIHEIKKEVKLVEYSKIQTEISNGYLSREDYRNVLTDGKLNYWNFYYLIGVAEISETHKRQKKERTEINQIKKDMLEKVDAE